MPVPVDPCNSDPCGPHSQCWQVNNFAACSCLAGYRGSPPNCQPECRTPSECASNLACINQKCRNPCPGACGASAECEMINHNAVCHCQQGFEGDPYEGCQRVTSPEAILITGGWGAEQSAELFLPWQNSTCELPALPDQRTDHVQAGNTLCGGYYSSTERSCLQWSVQQGDWVTLSLTLTKRRVGSSVWRVSQDNSLVIMGGWYVAEETSETVSSDGDSTRITFKMKYLTRRACSIPLGDEVVLTGGWYTRTTVSLYSTGGWKRDLSSLNTGRAEHGCTSYSTGGEQVLLVTGGWDDEGNALDSTELLRPGSYWQEITSARLPRPLQGVRLSTVDNRVLLFGGQNDEDIYSEDILEYKDGWKKVGQLQNGRSYPELSPINFNDFENYCNN